MILRVLAMILVLTPSAVAAEHRLVRLHAPDRLVETGLLKYALPRFSLKTQVRVELVGPDTADMVLGSDGRALFQEPSQIWKLDIRSTGHPGTQRLADWLRSDVGQRTIASFAPEGQPLFGPPAEVAEVVADIGFDADAELGHEVSRAKCTRCHAVDKATAGWGIGSTPSFGVLRAMPDWQDRFSAFYVLNPHPAFTQITGVTPPFPIERPSPIAPIELTLDEVEAVLSYVAAMEAADLGQPLTHQ
jgi:hypothetical protein